jgi:hypothetical protein
VFTISVELKVSHDGVLQACKILWLRFLLMIFFKISNIYRSRIEVCTLVVVVVGVVVVDVVVVDVVVVVVLVDVGVVSEAAAELEAPVVVYVSLLAKPDVVAVAVEEPELPGSVVDVVSSEGSAASSVGSATLTFSVVVPFPAFPGCLSEAACLEFVVTVLRAIF